MDNPGNNSGNSSKISPATGDMSEGNTLILRDAGSAEVNQKISRNNMARMLVIGLIVLGGGLGMIYAVRRKKESKEEA